MNAKSFSKLTDRQLLQRELKDYVMIAVGMLLYAIGWTVFLLPNDITSNGVPGIASIVYFATGIPVQYDAVFVLTFLLSVVQEMTKGIHLLGDQPFMACVIGAAFCGSGIGTAFSYNGSTGGTDIIAAIVHKYRDVSLGRIIMFCDIIIIGSSYFALHDWEKVVYGYVMMFISSFVLDQIVNSNRQSVQFFIISKHYEEIGHHINKDMHRGVTIIDGVGMYTGLGVKMMFVLAKKRESNAIFRLIQDIDPDAFVSQSAVIGVYGKGFDHIKIKQHKQPEKIIEAQTVEPKQS